MYFLRNKSISISFGKLSALSIKVFGTHFKYKQERTIKNFDLSFVYRMSLKIHKIVEHLII